MVGTLPSLFFCPREEERETRNEEKKKRREAEENKKRRKEKREETEEEEEERRRKKKKKLSPLSLCPPVPSGEGSRGGFAPLREHLRTREGFFAMMWTNIAIFR